MTSRVTAKAITIVAETRPHPVWALLVVTTRHRIRHQVFHLDAIALLVVLPKHELWLDFAMGFLRNIGRIGELEAMQAFWPDRAGKFPFDAGCELGVYEAQPRLDLDLTPREIKRFQRQFE